MALETEKQKTISAMVRRSLTSSIGAILGVKQQLCSSSPASWGLARPGGHIQIKYEPWRTCHGGSVTPILAGLCRLPAALVVLGDGTGEHAVYHCHGASSNISPLWVKIRSEGQVPYCSQWTWAAVGTKGWPLSQKHNLFCLHSANTTTMKWKNTIMPHKEKYSSCMGYKQTAAGLLLGKISEECSSGKYFNKSLNST